MQFFIDSADIEEIKMANKLGLVDGVTTNPSLISKTGRKINDVIHDICNEVDGPISVEVVSLKSEEMINEGKVFAKIHKNVVVKIPMCEDGLIAVQKLSKENIKTNVTLIFSPLQALMAAKSGATMISPFIGRLDDISINGMDLISQITQIYKNYAFKTKILVASIRNPLHILNAAQIGADIVTIPYKVIKQMGNHPLTAIGIDTFLKDWEKSQKQ